ncbi:MAG: glycerol acyltransferase [Sulfurimonas sp. RIFOXYD12_FULL_33_39]|uniref:1-acyl-sn-glycerol-3-phosphate acyltransferase n=1 Tax=unclassified Sulfurimonas TaxID=2623549 RepID=UPI0008D1FBE6|nr:MULTISPECIES: 1-acyl-sn-glycerol-3-phosphate acyltransferase [unclassified Sulfurimonas]OHE09273.1 MAG: glycerol acyltransferase [Sulfurimonas sp. RIFOXYD12_FULL_33_39]OHE12944.1 MAG: glycerol acyltransferase [Sulfurimonas sp. RIFOXYD2_FULL_34_21]DAB27819.1 MAG TPA: glycerol acyltransferase [Sulfurimonas sp. UBA10385]
MDLNKIKEQVLSYTSYIKELTIIIQNGYPFALVTPDFEALKRAKIINIEEEIRWYAIELYNMKADEQEKIKGYEILTTPILKTEDEPNDEIYTVLKLYVSTLSTNEIFPSSHLELDLGLDSLNYVELFVFIQESFGVKIDEAIFSNIMSMESLYMYIKNRSLHVKNFQFRWEDILAQNIDEKLVYSPFIMTLYKTFLYPIFKLYFRLEVKGRENILSSTCIIAPSHQSMLDGFLIESILPYKILKKSFFLAYKQVFGTTLLEPISRNGQTILIDANENLKHTMQYCALPIKSGNNLVIFPEGARTRDGELLEFRPYFAMLSKTFDVPIVPVMIDGSYEALKAGKLFPRPKKIKVVFLKPIYPNGLNYNEITALVRESIERELKQKSVMN